MIVHGIRNMISGLELVVVTFRLFVCIYQVLTDRPSTEGGGYGSFIHASVLELTFTDETACIHSQFEQ